MIGYAMVVDPAELDGEPDSRWCRCCGRRMDAAPLRGGCDCPHPGVERGTCASCGGAGTAPETRCGCRPAWLASVLS